MVKLMLIWCYYNDMIVGMRVITIVTDMTFDRMASFLVNMLVNLIVNVVINSMVNMMVNIGWFV